jgi:hypothetical protein
MNIIFDTQDLEQIKNNNILLELDTFYIPSMDKTTTAFCVIENIKITDFEKAPQIQKLHNQLLSAYKNKEFKLCLDLIESLMGSFNGEIDSFYQTLESRIIDAHNADTVSWSSVILK